MPLGRASHLLLKPTIGLAQPLYQHFELLRCVLPLLVPGCELPSRSVDVLAGQVGWVSVRDEAHRLSGGRKRNLKLFAEMVSLFRRVCRSLEGQPASEFPSHEFGLGLAN